MELAVKLKESTHTTVLAFSLLFLFHCVCSVWDQIFLNHKVVWKDWFLFYLQMFIYKFYKFLCRSR